MQRSLQDTDLWHTASSILVDGTGVFKSFFYRKSILAITYHVTTDLMLSLHGGPLTTAVTRDGIYLGILMLQGSLHTSGTAYSITTMMEYLRYSDNEAYWGGFAAGVAAGLAVDSTPWGVLKIALSVVAGVASRTSVSTLYANGKTLFSRCRSWIGGANHAADIEAGALEADEKYLPNQDASPSGLSII